MTHDYLLGSKRVHYGAVLLIFLVAAFLRWYRLDNCTLASGDEWLGIGPTFQFLEKFYRNPVTAIGFEALAGFPFVDIGRMGPPFDYTRSVVLVWSMPYYGVIGLFDFPVSEAWYRFPGTIWSLLGLFSTYFFVYQLTQKRVAALFAFALQATLIGHLVQSRFLVADGVFLFWYPLAGGFWLKYLRDRQPRTRHWAYLTSMLYASSTPEAIIGLAALFSLIIFWLWQEGEIQPFSKPFALWGYLRRIFIAYPLLWLVGFYGFQVLIELKFYLHDRANFLNHASYLGRFFGRGGGELSFYPERVLHWYIYPHISAPLILAAVLSLLLLTDKKWRAALAWGWLWSAFWVVLTLLVSNSSSNFTRIMHAVLVLGALGLFALYERRSEIGVSFAGVLVVANIWLVFDYPLLCAMPEDENVAQAVGYVVQKYGQEWGGQEAIAFYFPTGSLYAYIPESEYPRTPIFEGEYTFEGCQAQTVNPDSMAGVQVLITLPPDYDTQGALNFVLDYAVEYPCEALRYQALEDYAQQSGFEPVGQISDQEGVIHAIIWSKLPLEVGEINLEAANRWQYEHYSRRSWVAP